MVLPVPLRGQPVVVELGPGTGPMTHAIRQRLAGRGRHLAVELNPRMARLLAGRCPTSRSSRVTPASCPGSSPTARGGQGPVSYHLRTNVPNGQTIVDVPNDPASQHQVFATSEYGDVYIRYSNA